MKTLLLVDDDHHLCATLAPVIEQADHRVVTASGAEDALHVLRARRGRVDVVATDSHMPPGPGGLELLERVMLRYPSMGRWIFSARRPTRTPRFERIVHRFFRKPLQPGDLTRALTEHAIPGVHPSSAI